MRRIALLAALLALAAPLRAADPPADAPAVEVVQPAAAAPAPLPKPAVRGLEVRSGSFLFRVQLRPGAADPGQVVENRIEVAEVPPVPDPIYGEQVPVKDVSLTAAVADADGVGYTLTYQVHPLEDAGTYGFHFTPPRKDTYLVTLRGVYRDRPFDAEYRVPIGIWPIPGVKAGDGATGPARPAGGGRLPAVPAGMQGPAVSGGGAERVTLSVANASPLSQAMAQLGGLWADLQTGLYSGRTPELARAAKVAAEMRQVVAATASLQVPDPNFGRLMQELAEDIGGIEAAAAKGDRGRTEEATSKIGGRHCNRCHFVGRWHVLNAIEDFPAALP